MKISDVVITSAKRTAIGSLNKSLRNVQSYDLCAAVIKDLMKDSNLKAKEIDELILGQVLTAGLGQKPARQAAIK